ncbi:MAG TPA: hypothetical protein VF192_01430 [Longimicrobiales bacterium]
MKTYELLPRYAEQPLIQIEAEDREEAARIARDLADRGHAAGGYREGGALCPVEARDLRCEGCGVILENAGALRVCGSCRAEGRA